MDLYNIRNQLNMGIPLTKIKLRVTDYSRVSTDHEEQKNSLKNQIEHFDDMIKNNPNWTYVNGYVDEGITGTSDIKRDNFMKMIEDGKNGKFDLIITKEISRFSRNTLDSIKYTRELLNHGVAVLFVNDNINTALPDSELRLTIMASMAQDEIRRLSERVKFGMNVAIKKGHILGNNMLYGYKKDKSTGNLIIVKEESLIVRKIYTMYAIDKMSLSQIAKNLNSEGLKTGRGKNWCTSTIKRMLENPKYKGYYCGKKSEIIDYMTKKVKMLPENNWVMYEDKKKIPPIVDEDLWSRANARLEKVSKKIGRSYHDKTDKYHLSSKIYCKEHNTPFRRRKLSKASADVTWECAIYLKYGLKKCASLSIREKELYSIFENILTVLSIELENVSTILTSIYKTDRVNQEYTEKIEEYNKKKNSILKEKDKLLELNIEGHLSNEEFSIRNNKCNKELELLEEKITTLEKKKENPSNIKNQKLERLLKKKTKSLYIKEKLISLLVDKIIASKINNDRNNIELDIILNLQEEYTDKKKLPQKALDNDHFKVLLSNNYEFKRGYNTKCTKKYKVNYKVNALIPLSSYNMTNLTNI